MVCVAALAVWAATVEALPRGEVLRFGADEARRGGGAIDQRTSCHAISRLVSISAGNAADPAVDDFIFHAGRDVLFVAGRVVLEIARHALEAELFLHAALAVVCALLASAIGQEVSLEASEAGGNVVGLAGRAVAEARDALVGVH